MSHIQYLLSYLITFIYLSSCPPLCDWSINVIFFFFLSFSLFRAALAAYGGSQARRPIGAVATSLHQGHSNAGF